MTPRFRNNVSSAWETARSESRAVRLSGIGTKMMTHKQRAAARIITILRLLFVGFGSGFPSPFSITRNLVANRADWQGVLRMAIATERKAPEGGRSPRR
jgi:hypothetical protein